MNRSLVLRSLALAPLVWGVVDFPAEAQTSDPNAATQEVASRETKPRKRIVTSDSQDESAQSLIQTPAQQKYGLPRNPRTEAPEDIDLKKPLSLDRAIRIGLQRQNSIAIAQTQSVSAAARLQQARSSYYPQITPQFGYIVNKGVNVFGGVTFPTGNEILTNSFAVQQTIFDSGQREANVGNTRRTLFATEYSLADQRQAVILNVTENYFSLARSKELVRVQEQNVTRAKTNLEVIQAQVEQGVAARSDILQAEADLANAQVAYLQTLNDLNVSQASLKNSMGVVSNDEVTLTEAKAETPEVQPDTTGLESYVRAAYVNRPDLKSQQERINASGYQLRQANINAGLNVNATVSQGYQLEPASGETRNFNVQFSYPLFDGGNARAQVQDARATLESQRRNLDQLQQTVRLNVEQAYLVRELSRQRVVASQAAFRAGQLNYEAALERQRNGIINILEVINAQVQLVTAEVNLVQAVYDFYIADARLLRNVGLNDPNYIPKIPGYKSELIRVPNVGRTPFRTGLTSPAQPLTVGTAPANPPVAVGRKP